MSTGIGVFRNYGRWLTPGYSLVHPTGRVMSFRDSEIYGVRDLVFLWENQRNCARHESRESTKGNRIVALCRANDSSLIVLLLAPACIQGGQQVSGWNGRWKVTLKLHNSLGRNLVDISREVARQQTVVTNGSFPKIYRLANLTVQNHSHSFMCLFEIVKLHQTIETSCTWMRK